MTRIAIIAALPGELRPLVRGWRRESRGGVELRWCRRGESEWIAAWAGTGAGAALRAWEQVERAGAIDAVISTGWAGALQPPWAVGCAYRVSGVIDARTGERFATAPEAVAPEAVAPDRGLAAGSLWLVTHDRVADGAEKVRLAAVHGAGLVDMEAAAIARIARSRGVPFHCVKGVSDGPADRLPDLNRFLSPAGQFQLARFIRFAAVRPGIWPALIRLGRSSRRAAEALAPALLACLEGSAR
jgi:adenosylhomocysteine nucleosidase